MRQPSEKIVEYLQGLDIKTVMLSGFDKAETFEALRQLSVLYEEELDQQESKVKAAAEGQIEQMRRELLRVQIERNVYVQQQKNDQKRIAELTESLRMASMRPGPAPAKAEYLNKVEEASRAGAYFQTEKKNMQATLEAEKNRLHLEAKIKLEQAIRDSQAEIKRQRDQAAAELEKLEADKRMITEQLSALYIRLGENIGAHNEAI